jgi:NADH-quinone oxidoreductase subunit C/D
MTEEPGIINDLQARFGPERFSLQSTVDKVPTLWVNAGELHEVLRYLKTEVAQPFRTLYDLTAIDERTRANRVGQPDSDFTVVYHLRSYERNADVRLKVPLKGEYPSLRTVTDIWPAANWYEREVWDMFGTKFEGHPNLRRILTPKTWEGHPLRKEHPARATEMGPFRLTDEREEEEVEALRFRPEEWGLERHGLEEDYLFLNVGPQHPGTHGPFRIILQLNGEEIVDAIPDIGYHHRAKEKMAERQSWHTFLPYTDRVDYLGGVANELAYCTAVEQLAGIALPDRAKVIRIMLTEIFRISNHLVYMGTYAQDLGQLSPVFYMFNDRERLLKIVEHICGARMHPVWFRLGGTQQDLPRDWDALVQDFLDYFPARLAEHEQTVLYNSVFKARTEGIGQITQDDAIEWGATGPMLRSTGVAWDTRKTRPYGGYDQFQFEVPTDTRCDAYGRAVVHMAEMWQSLSIIQQCVDNMPSGPYKSDHPLTTPPVKPYTMRDIETLIHHFLGVTWGPVMPVGESTYPVEAVKGNNSYYVISDGDVIPYRVRIRTPSFAHLQMIPMMTRGYLLPDLSATLGSIDFVMSDVDR